MRYARVAIESIAYELPATIITSRAIEERLSPLYRELRLQPGQVEALTGIRERRYWPTRHTMAEGAVKAARKALAKSAVKPDQIGMLIYGGVCRDQLEPATACAVADALGLGGATQVYDVSNACLGVINGIMQVANAIELGQVRAGLVVSCESARQIVDLTIERMLADRNMETFRHCLATLTGGSGAVAVVVCDNTRTPRGHELVGGVIRSRAQWHRLCRWGPDTGIPASAPMCMDTDAVGVMEHGVELGTETWFAFLEEMGWTAEQIDRTICHQVGAPHRDYVLKQLGIPPQKDFVTYEFLGNIGTVSLPITAAIAAERGFLQSGQRVAFCGIGSGLNCLILGVQW
jgi:3-oxoacyl-[acyl-carrier-protein] synthase-3